MTLKRACSSFVGMYISAMLSMAAQANELGPKANPSSSGTSSNTATVGQVTPPRREASSTLDKSAELPPQHRAGRDPPVRIICIDCEPGKSKSKVIYDKGFSQKKHNIDTIKIDEMRKFPEPKTQGDLDTLTLASAHRERAGSAQEKTDGLWQSWLVSVCEGCGDQKPSKAWKLEDWPTVRRGPFVPDAMDRITSSGEKDPIEPRKITARQHGAFEADLSPENVGSIRRMPQR